MKELRRNKKMVLDRSKVTYNKSAEKVKKEPEKVDLEKSKDVKKSKESKK